MASLITETVGNVTVEQILAFGLDIAEGMSEHKLEQAATEHNALVLVGHAAGKFSLQCHRVRTFQYSDELTQQEEFDFPFHAAIQFSDMEELEHAMKTHPDLINMPDLKNALHLTLLPYVESPRW